MTGDPSIEFKELNDGRIGERAIRLRQRACV